MEVEKIRMSRRYLTRVARTSVNLRQSFGNVDHNVICKTCVHTYPKDSRVSQKMLLKWNTDD